MRSGLASLSLVAALALSACGGDAPGAPAAPSTPPPPSPAIASVSPASGPVAGGTHVTLSGSGFAGSVAVTFGGVPVTVTSVSAATVVVLAPPHAAGVVDVVLSNGDGQSSTRPGAFTYELVAVVPAPVLASLSVTQGGTGGGTPVLLAGSGFATGATVSFGGSAAPATVLSSTSISATTPAHGAGTVDVSVSNPDGQGTTLAAAFTYTAPAGTPPVVSSLSPAQGPATGGTLVTVTGSGFTAGLTVSFGGAAGAVVGTVSPGSFQATTPLAQPAGRVDVTVTLPGSGLSGTLPGGFGYLGPAPTVSAMSVRGGPPAGGTIVLLAGTGLQAGTSVTFGGVPAPGVSYDPVQDRLQATTPPCALGPGADTFVEVVLTNPDGQAATVATPFHYGPRPAPTGLAAVAPATLTTVHRGDTIVITGTDFTAAPAPDPRAGLQVSIGAIAAIVSKTATEIVVTAPKNNPGTYQVVVVNFDGQYAVAPGVVVYPGP